MAETKLKRGTIFKNNWAANETYFVYERTLPLHNIEAQKVTGWQVVKLDGEWVLRENAQYYRKDIEKSENFPVVGHVDTSLFAKLIMLTILSAIGK